VRLHTQQCASSTFLDVLPNLAHSKCAT